MEEKTTLDQWDPFNFRIEGAFGFKFHIEGLIREGRLETALERIELIREKYLHARDFNKIKGNSFRFSHFNSYRAEQTELSSRGEAFPDGSTDKVIFELNELAKAIREKQIKNPSPSRKDGATIDRLALLLFFIKGERYNPDFDKVAKEYQLKNGEKLSKTFSVFTKKDIRRFGPCKELESHTQKLNRIEEYKWAIDRLPPDKKQMAIDEMNTLISRLTVEE